MPACTVGVSGYAMSRLASFSVLCEGSCSVVFSCLSQVSGHGSSIYHQEFFASPDGFCSLELGLVLPDGDSEVVGFSVFSAGTVYK